MINTEILYFFTMHTYGITVRKRAFIGQNSPDSTNRNLYDSKYMMSSNVLSKPEIITIEISRLHYLEELERNLPTLIENALKENKANALKRLHEKDKENPAAVNLRVKRYVEKNREKINERRREQRQLKNTGSHTPASDPTSESLGLIMPPPTPPPPPTIKREVPHGGVTIRFLN